MHQNDSIASLDGHLHEPRSTPHHFRINKRKAVHAALTIKLSEGKGSVSGFAFPFQTLGHGVVRRVSRQYYEDHGQNRRSWERLVLFILHIHHRLFTVVH